MTLFQSDFDRIFEMIGFSAIAIFSLQNALIQRSFTGQLKAYFYITEGKFNVKKNCSLKRKASQGLEPRKNF
jgi:hypothetical protein